jgi:hypothetical protein
MKSPLTKTAIFLIAAGFVLFICAMITNNLVGNLPDIVWMAVGICTSIISGTGIILWVASAITSQLNALKIEGRAEITVGATLTMICASYTLLFSALILINFGRIGHEFTSTMEGVTLSILLNLPIITMAILVLIGKLPENTKSKMKIILIKALAIYAIAVTAYNMVTVGCNVGKPATYTLEKVLTSSAIFLPILALSILVIVIFVKNRRRGLS